MKSSGTLVFLIVATSFFSCKTEEIILHGDLTGKVTDASTSEPIIAASVKLTNTNDSTFTGSDGIYLIEHLAPRDYDIQASKSSFVTSNNKVTVVSSKTQVNDFSLNPLPKISVSILDFGLESTSLTFTVSYTGKTKLSYLFSTSQNWITVHPSSGELFGETDTITVTINKTGLTENIYKETIKMTSVVDQVTFPDIITGVYLNGLIDKDGNYYKVVKIGTQMWMAENLNVGIPIPNDNDQKDNSIIEKYYYNNASQYGNKYGGLYQFYEMMQYSKPDSGSVGTTQGVCPDGWHIPSTSEWHTLFDYLGGLLNAGGKLKDTGTLWQVPNLGATNESGFSGLPGGFMSDQYYCSSPGRCYVYEGQRGVWWSSTGDIFWLQFDLVQASINQNFSPLGPDHFYHAFSVRCVKNIGK